MTIHRAILLTILATFLVACGTTQKKPASSNLRAPVGQASKTIRQPRPETSMTLKVQPREPGAVPPSSAADPTTATDSDTTITIEGGEKSSGKASSEQVSKQPKLPSYTGKMQTGLISPTTPRKESSASLPDTEKVRVRFTFDKADIGEVTNQIFDDFLKVNYVLDPTLQGRISFYIEGEYTKEELYEMIFKAYEANNVSIVPRNGIYYIHPLQKGSNASLPIASSVILQEKEGIRPVIAIYRLKYMDVKQAINTIKAFITPGRLVTSDPLTNSIVFVEDSENARGIVEILKALDVNVLQEVSMEIVPVTGMTPQDAVQGMESLIGKLDIFKQSALKGNLAFIPLPSFGGVLVLAQNQDMLKTARYWLEALDVHGQEAGEQIHVYFVQNALAIDIADIVGQVLGLQTGGGGRPSQRIVESTSGGVFGSSFGRSTGGGGFGSTSGSRFGSSFGGGITGSTFGRSGMGTSSTTGGTFGGTSLGDTTGMTGGSRTGGGALQQRRTTSRPTGAGGTGGTGGAPGEVLTGQPIIIPDEVNNAIVVRANATDWAKIRKTIETLDIVPRAVLIEVMVAEVSLTKNMEYGLEWFFRDIGMNFLGKEGTMRAVHGQVGTSTSNTNNGTGTGTGTGTSIGSDSSGLNLTSALAGTSGLNLFWGSLDQKIAVLLKLLASKTEVNVLSHPTLLATDNKEASIHIGGREPVPTGSISGGTTGDLTNVLSTIEYAETGLILNVTPHINAGGLVRLEVEQSIIRTDPNAATIGVNTSAPRFTERNIKTTLLAQDGSTVVIGGIIQQAENNAKNGIPGLQDVPILSPLFSSKGKRTDKTEIIIAISPHVVSHRDTSSTREFLDALQRLKSKIEK